MTPAAKRRLVRAFERYVQNPPVKLALLLGVPNPVLALLETTGRRTGKQRRIPVIRGLAGDTFWIVAEHGHRAAYVRNIKANPHVRIKLGRRWLPGTAHILDDDDPLARARWMADQLGGWHRFDVLAARLFGTEPVTLKVDLSGQAPARDGLRRRDERHHHPCPGQARRGGGERGARRGVERQPSRSHGAQT